MARGAWKISLRAAAERWHVLGITEPPARLVLPTPLLPKYKTVFGAVFIAGVGKSRV